MAQSKKTTKEKKTNKSNSRTTGKTKSPNKIISNNNFNAFAALIIMGLLTVIIMLVNNIYFGKSKKISFDHKNVQVIKAQELIAKRNIAEDNNLNLKIKENIIGKEKLPVNNIIKDNNDTQKKLDGPKKGKIKLYFVKLDHQSEKIYLSSVKRNISGHSTLRNALSQLIKGPTSIEKKKGLLTAIPPGLKIKNVRVRNRTAEINFNEAIEEGGNGNILIKRIDQIVYTATQFDNIDSVIFKINGKKKKSLGSDGLSISGPIHRRK